MINPANSDLFAGFLLANIIIFAGVIRQIVTYYLPDNQGFGKRGGSHACKFSIFSHENVFFGMFIFQLGGTRLVFGPSYSEVKFR